MMNTYELVKRYRDGMFSLDLMDAVVTQRAVDKPLTFRGKGIIVYEPGQDWFNLRIFPDLPAHPDPSMPIWPSREELKPGSLLPDHHTFDLKAVALDGNTWLSQSLWLQPHVGNGVVLTSKIRVLTCMSPLALREAHDHTTLFYFNGLELPFTQYVDRISKADGKRVGGGFGLDRHESQCGSLHFAAARLEGYKDLSYLTITALDGEVPACAESRVNEALGYALGRQLLAPVTERWVGPNQVVTLRPVRNDRPGWFDSPVPSDRVPFAKDFWVFFAAYLTHTINDPAPQRLHPLSRQLSRVLSAGHTNLDVNGLLVCIAIEGVLNFDAFVSVPLPAHGGTGDATVSASGKTRQHKVNAANKLRTLHQHGFISQRMVEAWRELRNSSAHGEMSVDGSYEPRFTENCFAVYALLNCLVFLVVGYQGKYTDYSLPDWPIMSFPGAQFPNLRAAWAECRAT